MYERGGNLGYVIWAIYANFCSSFMLNLALIGRAVLEKIIVNGGRRLDGRRLKRTDAR